MVSVKSLVVAHARAMWRRRWFALAVAWLVCLVGWTFVMRLPDQYEAKARVYVDTDSMLRPLLQGIAIDSNILSQVDLMERTLLSTPNLQKVSHVADLDLNVKTPADSQVLVEHLRQAVTVSGQGHNLFSLEYTGASRELATKVVQALLQVFVESNLGNSRQDMVASRAFLDAQLRDYGAQLDAAEQELADFKKKNVGYLPGDENFSSKLEAAMQQLERTNAELEEARQERAEMAKELTGMPQTVDYTGSGASMGAGPPIAAGPPLGGSGPPMGGGSAGSGASGGNSEFAEASQKLAEVNARLAELEKKREALLENDTPQHPDVLNIDRLIGIAKREQAEAKRAAGSGPRAAHDTGVGHSTGPNPVFEQLQLKLADLDTQIASLEVRVQHAQADVDKWKGLARDVPEISAQLSKLTRNYGAIKATYDQLLARREAARIGNEMETQTQTVQFRIVDPPVASTEPVAPKRRLLLSVVLFAGISAGAAFAFLLSQIDDSIMTVRQLKDAIALPVLGAVSLVATTSRSGAQRFAMAGFLAVCVGLVLVYAGIISLETFGRLRA